MIRQNPLAKPEHLNYPVLCFARDNSVSVARYPAELCGCNATAWFGNRYFDELRLFDAAAMPYRVHSAQLATPLYGWRRILARVRNQKLVAVLELECLGEASLANAKETAIQWLHRAPDFWEEALDLPEWESLVAQAADMNALCAVFG